MKRMVAFVSAAILVAPAQGAAQSALGFRGGLTLTDVSVEGEEAVELESTTGVVFGGVVEFPLGETLDLQLGLSYTQKGAEPGEGQDVNGVSLDYIEVPVLAVWGLPASGPVGARLMAGPVVSFELSCELTGGVGGIGDSLDCEPAGVRTNSTDFGVEIGGGVFYRIEDGATLFLDGGYNFGLTSWRDDPTGDETSRNRALLFTVGATFPLR